jgi:tRNA-splicing endonuclease subunit Sen15, fungi type
MAISMSRRPEPSPLSTLISTTTSSLPYDTSTLFALPLEILHNLQYQHSWAELELHYIDPQSHSIHQIRLSEDSRPCIPPSSSQFLISGLPPRHTYVHPDLQTQLLKEGQTQKDVCIQREWVIPLSLGQKPNVSWLAGIFDTLPQRDDLVLDRSTDHRVKDEDETEHLDSASTEHVSGKSLPASDYPNPKRVLMAMKSQDGLGGDGTVAYYVCLEGEVKPRQNG